MPIPPHAGRAGATKFYEILLTSGEEKAKLTINKLSQSQPTVKRKIHNEN